MGGLLIDGREVEVPGVTVIGPHEAKWAHLDPGDFCHRPTAPHQIILHKTKGGVPEVIQPGHGPAGRAERTADFWADDPKHSGAHIVSGSDGVVGCLADVVRVEAYHATVSNRWSIGIETYEEQGGVVYQAALDSTVLVVKTLAIECGIQLQVPDHYAGRPIPRMAAGGRDCYGVFGHRDNTDERGHWDPGDHLFDMLVHELGAERMDFHAGQDLEIWKRRQTKLAALNLYRGAIDGEPGPGTCAALKTLGFPGGVFALGPAELRQFVDA